MVSPVREAFNAIWQPVFRDGTPDEAAVRDAWARTRDLLAAVYGPDLSEEHMRDLLAEIALAWLLRAMSPTADAADSALASLAQQAALALGVLAYDVDRVYEGYFRLLRAWGVYR